MSTLEIISSKAEQLPQELQQEVADFADFLLQKVGQNHTSEHDWSTASMHNALRGFEDDPITYSKSDVESDGI